MDERDVRNPLTRQANIDMTREGTEPFVGTSRDTLVTWSGSGSRPPYLNSFQWTTGASTSTEDERYDVSQESRRGQGNTSPQRSTKGASKQRRDLINGEISVLRDLLPLPEAARQRLSQLQIMSLACVYIRKCNFFSRLFGDGELSGESSFEFSQTMTGFLLIATKDGKLLYISENVTEYLGHSMVDMMTQGDSVYDIIDKRDHSLVQTHLMSGPTSVSQSSSSEAREENTFFCRMNVARSFRRQAGFGDHKMMHVKGHFMQPVIRDHYGNQPVFMAICTPLITPDVKETTVQNSTTTFYSAHSLDMKYTEIGHIGQHHLGYNEQSLIGKSWYELLHPEDVHEAKEKHVQLIKSSHEMGCMLTVRLQSSVGTWVWVNIVMHIRQPFVCDNGEPAIVCINQVIDDCEAAHFKLQSQLYSSHIARSPEFLGSPQGASPQHTITQVPVEGGNYSLQQSFMPSQSQCQTSDEGQGLPYSIDFLTSGTSVSSMAPQMSSSGERHSVQHQVGGTTGLHSDHASDSSGSPKERSHTTDDKQNLRADLFNRLKRKLSDSSNGQQCRPAKRVHVVDNGNNGGMSAGSGTAAYQASALIANVSLLESLGGGFSSMGSGDIQVLAPVHDSPVYQQLRFKKDIILKQKDTTARSLSVISPQLFQETTIKPPTPLTPDSLTSEGSVDHTRDVATIDCMDNAYIPASILTPDASPQSSTMDELCNSPMSHLDQTLDYNTPSELIEVNFFDDNKNLKTQIPPAVTRTNPATVALSPCMEDSRLPIIDTVSLERMLCDLEQKPAEVPTFTLPATPEQVQETVVQEMPSPTSQEHNDQLQVVTNALMDIVQQASDGSLDLRQFMLEPVELEQTTENDVTDMEQRVLAKTDDTLAGLGSALAMMTSQSSMSDQEFLLFDDYVQLDDMDLPPPPPYGDCDLPSSVVA